MKSSIKIWEIWNIPVKIHLSFLLILPAFAWLFANNEYFFLRFDTLISYSLGVTLALFFFFCVFLHELGHSYVALKNDIKIKNITMMIFGGVASMEDVKEDPDVELKLAIAGPLVSIVIGVFLIVTNYLLGFPFPLLGNGTSLAGIFIGWTGYINLVLAGFNLIPAFPMDGGRVLRSFFAKRMSYIDATERAAGIGKAFAFALGLLGILILPGGIWLILIASFIYIGASEEERSTKISKTLSGVKVRDLMTDDVITVDPEWPISKIIHLVMKKKHMGYPVVKDNKLIGIITFTDIREIPNQKRELTKVREVMSKDVITIDENSDAFEALKLISKEDIGRLPVMSDEGLVGILSRSDFTTAIELGKMKK